MPARVHIHDRVVPAVAVSVERLGISWVRDDTVRGHEPRQEGIILPGTVVVETQFAVILLVGELVLLRRGAGDEFPVGLVAAVLGTASVEIGFDAGALDVVFMEVPDRTPFVLRNPYPVDEDIVDGRRAVNPRTFIEV